MNFNVIITDEGRALLTTIINNNYWLYIDQPRMSENNYVGQEASLTEATFDGVFTYGTAAKSIIDATTLRLKISFDNNYLVADHDLYTIGVIARAVDPDTHQTVGSDALLAVCTTNTPTPIPAGASYYSQWAYNVNLSVGSTQNMTVVATQAGVQYVDLTTPLTINGNTENTVEDALDGLNDYGDALADNLAANENVCGAKNLLAYPYKETSKSDAGITFTDNGNGTVTISGTASANTDFTFHKYSEQTLFLNNGSYILSAGAFISGVYVGAVKRESDGTYTYYDTLGGDVPITINGSYDSANGAYLEVSIQVLSGAVISTPVTLYPMIRDARIIDPTFAPYAKTNKQLTDDKAERTDISTIHATGSTNTTGAQIDAGTFFYLNGQFCKALADIAVNATFTLNTNYKVDSVGKELKTITYNSPIRKGLDAGSSVSYTVPNGVYLVTSWQAGASAAFSGLWIAFVTPYATGCSVFPLVTPSYITVSVNADTITISNSDSLYSVQTNITCITEAI